MKFIKGKYSFAIIYTIILILASVFVMYDALKLEKDAIKVAFFFVAIILNFYYVFVKMLKSNVFL